MAMVNTALKKIDLNSLDLIEFKLQKGSDKGGQSNNIPHQNILTHFAGLAAPNTILIKVDLIQSPVT